ncbi:MAG: hypothetical protein KC917_05415 [Candidatus Omnitrophica bacterium]|nr:hypothetical protein [Candidatus Omnitrophota bacterium]
MPRYADRSLAEKGFRLSLILLLFSLAAFSKVGPAVGQREEFRGEEGLELPLIEDVDERIRRREEEERERKPVKSKKKYPYDVIDAETTYRYGYDDNVFRSSSIPVPGDPKVLRHQGSEYQEGWFDFEFDRYYSLGTKLSIDYFYKGEFFEEFRSKERQRNTLRLQWQERLDKGEYLRAGIRESRRLATAHNRFGEKLKTDIDYYRTDLYLEYEFDLNDIDEIELEYRFVNYDYDEYPGDLSDDWHENRISIDWDRELTQDTTLNFFARNKWRSYREEYARRGVDGERIPGTLRRQGNLEFGVGIEKVFRPGFEVDLEVSYEDLADDYQDYYSYGGLNFRFDLEYPITEKLRFEADGRIYKRDFDNRRFLASRQPNPFPPPSRLDPFIELYEDYLVRLGLFYEYSDKLELGLGWRHRWYRVSDPTEAFRENRVFFQVRYYFKKVSSL